MEELKIGRGCKGLRNDKWSVWFGHNNHIAFRTWLRQLHVPVPCADIVSCPWYKPSHRPSTVKQCSTRQARRSSVATLCNHHSVALQHSRVCTCRRGMTQSRLEVYLLCSHYVRSFRVPTCTLYYAHFSAGVIHAPLDKNSHKIPSPDSMAVMESTSLEQL